MQFDAVSHAVRDLPYMTPEQGLIVYEHVRRTRPRRALELGTAHGVGASYIAAALPPGGRLVTVDHEGAAFEPSPEVVLERADLLDRVEIVRRCSSYTWWLKEQVEQLSDKNGNCTPVFDFVYLDGAKNWTIDGLAVVLIEKLLRPDGWLLMDDLNWTYADDPAREVCDGVVVRNLPPGERREPHLRAVFDLIVAQHPAFTELRIQDDWWGWAHKAADAPRRLEITTSRPLTALVGVSARRARRALRRRIRSRRSSFAP